MYKRQHIIARDKHCCKKCGKSGTEWIDGKNVWVDWVVVKDSFIDSSLRELGWTNKDVVIEVEIDELQVIDAEKPYHLEVHHKYYLENTLPWQYPDDALVTLCNWCHQEVHDTTVIPVLSNEGEALGYTPCSRCNGSGSFPEYSHVQSGVCFKCNGARYEELIDK